MRREALFWPETLGPPAPYKAYGGRTSPSSDSSLATRPLIWLCFGITLLLRRRPFGAAPLIRVG